MNSPSKMWAARGPRRSAMDVAESLPCPKTASSLGISRYSLFTWRQAQGCTATIQDSSPPFARKIPVLTADFLLACLPPGYIAVPCAGPGRPKRRTALFFPQRRRLNRRATGHACFAGRNLLRGCRLPTLPHPWRNALQE